MRVSQSFTSRFVLQSRHNRSEEAAQEVLLQLRKQAVTLQHVNSMESNARERLRLNMQLGKCDDAREALLTVCAEEQALQSARVQADHEAALLRAMLLMVVLGVAMPWVYAVGPRALAPLQSLLEPGSVRYEWFFMWR